MNYMKRCANVYVEVVAGDQAYNFIIELFRGNERKLVVENFFQTLADFTRAVAILLWLLFKWSNQITANTHINTHEEVSHISFLWIARINLVDRNIRLLCVRTLHTVCKASLRNVYTCWTSLIQLIRQNALERYRIVRAEFVIIFGITHSFVLLIKSLISRIEKKKKTFSNGNVINEIRHRIFLICANNCDDMPWSTLFAYCFCNSIILRSRSRFSAVDMSWLLWMGLQSAFHVYQYRYRPCRSMKTYIYIGAFANYSFSFSLHFKNINSLPVTLF